MDYARFPALCAGYIFSSRSDWLIGLFALSWLVRGHYLGFGFTIVTSKPLHLRKVWTWLFILKMKIMLFIVEHIPFFFQSRWTLDISGMCYFSRLGIHWFTNQIKFIFNFKDLDKLRLCTSFQFAVWLSLESHHFAKVIKQCCCKVGILRKFIFPVLQTCFSNVFCVLFIYRQHSGCGWWDFSVRMPLDHLYRRCELLCCAEWRAVLATREWYEEQLENRKTSKHS